MKKILCFFLIFAGLQSNAYVGSVNAATADAGLAAVEASEAPFMNPAILGHMKGYYFSAGFGSAKQTTVGNNQDFAVAVTDAMPDTIVPTSFSYVQNSQKLEGQVDNTIAREFKLYFGNRMSKNLAFGLGVVHNMDRVESDSYQQTNLETGFLWSPNNELGIAVIARQLIEPKASVPEPIRQQQSLGVGATYNYKKFVRVKADINSGQNNDFKYSKIGAGMESYLNRWLVIRWGLGRDNQQKADQYSAGLGFMGPKFALNYAYQNSPQNERLTRHSVDLALPIW